jgi:hypothetical protein
MKLDPVMLVAPTRDRASMPTRRAFLIAGGTFVLGSGFGGACGFAMGRGSVAAAPAEELAPSGDVELDELRRLAVKAPIEELIERRMVFVELLRRSYRRDLVLWRGMKRLVDALLGDPRFPDRRIFSRVLAQVIEQADRDVTGVVQPAVGELRKIR